MRIDSVLVTCEHGGHRVPAEWATLFRGAERVLRSHRGWDPGALGMARRVARRLDAPLHTSTVTRLLVELNRSEHHPALFSSFTRDLPDDRKRKILARYYRPYREDVETSAREALGDGRRVLHLSMHSFTPVLDGTRRQADVGLLYDPARGAERAFAAEWVRILKREAPELRVRRNYPYRGVSDGLSTHLRRRLGPRYLGMELEVNQRFFFVTGEPRSPAIRAIERSVALLAGPGAVLRRG